MKKALFICCILFASFSHAHDTFFAYAEVEYDDFSGKIEATISMTSHDLEKYLQERNIITKGLSVSLEDSVNQELISSEILKYFQINVFGKRTDVLNGIQAIELTLDGFELLRTGTIVFYYSAEIANHFDHFEVKFDLFMDEFPEQQNKLHLIYRDKKRDFVFLPATKKQYIEL